jgi:hypothetical protein
MRLAVTSFLLVVLMNICHGQSDSNVIRLGKGEPGPNLGEVIKIDGLYLRGKDQKKILNIFGAHKDLFLVKKVGEEFLAVDPIDCRTDSCEFFSTTNYWYNGKHLKDIINKQMVLGRIETLDDYDFKIVRRKNQVNIYISGKKFSGRKYP